MADVASPKLDETSPLVQAPGSPVPEKKKFYAPHDEKDSWEFSTVHKDEDLYSKMPADFGLDSKHKLGQLMATAISGNDITSSCLYVAGLSVAAGGTYAPFSLLGVTFLLYLFRNVYAEVGSALPLNGGAYNVLLNTTTKFLASVAACLTMLSYVSTAVVSGSEAMEYLHDLVEKIDPYWATIACLGVFALLTLLGIGESAIVALIIFSLHLATLTLLIIFCAIYAWKDGWKTLILNWHRPPLRSVAEDIFFGFCCGLLGVSGFETSSNYIEEQAKGVFPKTLRNMWISVAIFNPLISLLSLSMFSVNEIITNQRVVLSHMGRRAAGEWLGMIVSVDAVLVLSGAVLTAYVGVTGLMHRMSMDRILPSFFTHKNPCRNTNHFIIITFFIVTSLLFIIVNNNVTTLGGVYTVSFLSVMGLFAMGNMLLKYKRAKLPRSNRTLWPFVALAFVSVETALVGNIIYAPDVIKYFSIYFSFTLLIVFGMIGRIRVLKMIFFFVQQSFLNKYMGNWMKLKMKNIQNKYMIFFTRNGDLHVLNKAMMYIRDNELTSKLKVIHVYEDEEKIPPKLKDNVAILDRLYPKLRVDLLLLKGRFTPQFVSFVAHSLHVPKNFMYMGCPNEHFNFSIGEFGGVRLITH